MGDKYTGTSLVPKDGTHEDTNKAALDLLKKINEGAGDLSGINDLLSAKIDALTASIASLASTIVTIDIGSNANGYWEKYSNGIIVCHGLIASTGGALSHWTFPNIAAPFVLALMPVLCWGNLAAGAGTARVCVFETALAASVGWGDIVTNTTNYAGVAENFFLHAYGKWK
jgi:hypothetical protein